MNVLDKILEEIEDRIKISDDCNENLAFIDGIRYGLIEAKKIIRSHMNNLQDADAEEKSILCTVGEDGVLTSYDDTYDIVIHCSNKEDQNRTIELIKSFNWIPISEALPEKTGYYLAQLSRKLPNEDYSDRVVILFNGEEKEFMCYAELIIAWQPLPEPYKGE